MVVLRRICRSYVQRTVFRGILAESGWLTCLFFLDAMAEMDALSREWGVFLVFECCVQETLQVIMPGGTGESRQRYQHLTFKLGCNLSSPQCARNALAGIPRLPSCFCGSVSRLIRATACVVAELVGLSFTEVRSL